MSTDQMTLDDRFPWEEEDEAPPAPAGAASEAAPAASVDAPTQEAPTTAPDASPVDGALDGVVEDASAPAANRPVAPKEYYSISEVCDIVGLKPHVLRYWETQFQVLNPSKNRSGNRVYQRKEIKLILLVKHLLYEEKYTVEGARAKLDQLRRTGRLPEMTGRAMTAETATMVRDELRELLTVLAAADDGA
jgi:DNA-binding transcriptional MerR regulator